MSPPHERRAPPLDVPPARTPAVKICGLTRAADVRVAAACGADYVGFVLSEGFRRSVPAETAAAALSGPEAAAGALVAVAVLVDEDAADAVQRATALGAGVVQLHGHEPPDVVRAVREAGPWQVWKAVRVRSVDTLVRAVDRYGGRVDGFLLEGWKEGVVGGGGVRLAAVEPERVRGYLPDAATFVLAGGLRPGTVADAVVRFGPDVVDVSSGVEEAPGRKRPDAVRQFVEAVRGRPMPETTPESPA